MTRKPVTSSNIDSIGYDHKTNILEVGFSRGDVYEYDNISDKLYHNLMLADSIGRYFRDNIDGNPNYPCKRIGNI